MRFERRATYQASGVLIVEGAGTAWSRDSYYMVGGGRRENMGNSEERFRHTMVEDEDRKLQGRMSERASDYRLDEVSVAADNG